MDENNELLVHIYKTSEMGMLSTKQLLNTLKKKENKNSEKIRNAIDNIPIIILVIDQFPYFTF